jgi:transcriptional regulator with XRE-family HTH domain
MTGSVIREIRLRAGLTQKQLARRLGTKQSVVSRWETGSAAPTLETLQTIARVCGFEVRLQVAERNDHDLRLAIMNLKFTPEERIDKMVAGIRFADEMRAAMREQHGV